MSHAIKGNPVNELESLQPDYLKNEAHDYLRIFHTDMKTSEADYQKRLEEVDREIKHSGTYTHTPDEIEYGAQLAWRNASRCINRLFWHTMKVIDRRQIKTNDEMFDAICDHMRYAYNEGALQASCLVMNPKSRVWTSQYFRYACYEQPDGSLLGDPANRELTKVAMELGWNKTEAERTEWDFLPVIVQVDPNETPSWYEIPEDLRYEVFLSHPDPKYNTAIKSLGLRWCAQPFVADKAIEIGGIFYRCVPFSGWFMQTEVGRDLCDIQRYNFIPKLAAALDLDISAAANSKLNVDRLYVEVNAAILHSFEKAKVAIVDHHTAAAGFLKFMKAEIKQRGNTPADWVWLTPPISSGMSVIFHQEMLNYILKPRVVDQVEPWILYAPLKKRKQMLEMPLRSKIRHRWLTLRAARVVIGFAMKAMKQRISVNVLYASSSGTAHSYAQQMFKRLLYVGYNPVLMELDSYPFFQQADIRSINIIITSTFGQGNAPDGGIKVEEWLTSGKTNLNDDNKHADDSSVAHSSETASTMCSPLLWCSYAVCAIGSSAYPFYCGFGKLVDTKFEELGGKRLLPMGTCDALNQQLKSYNEWETLAVKTLRKAYPHACLRLEIDETVSANASRPDRGTFSNVEDQLIFNTSILSASISLEFYSDRKKRMAPAEHKGPFTRDKPFVATVLQNIELVTVQNILGDAAIESSKRFSANPQNQFQQSSISSIVRTITIDEQHSVRLLVFDATGLSYSPGDHVCVLPENTLSNVNDFLLACGWKPDDERLDQSCSLASLTNGKYETIREILTQYIDLITTPQPHILKLIASFASDPGEQRAILELGKGAQRYEDWKINAPSVKEMLNQFPSVKIPLDEIIQILPKLQPRYYSISSSTRFNENQLHITVGVATYITPRGVIREGICSSYLQQTVPLLSLDGKKTDPSAAEKASKVKLFVLPNIHFRLPGSDKKSTNMPPTVNISEDLFVPLNSPLLMVAVGSGIAPFRSFWQELQMLQSLKGKSEIKIDRVLFMGCRTPNDFLYAKELESISCNTDNNENILTTVVPVYSRGTSAAKRYVQDAMFDYEALIYSIVKHENGFIYMCGSTRACQGVESALASIIENCSEDGITSEEAADFIKRLKENGKIKQDMFG
ncbi:unnamed protein product [Rotaria sp. Silwood1]|nr:unnamed protein product [Rotaria sp. Silwood1]